MTIISLIDRFNLKYKINNTTGCWEWFASKTIKGYGQIYVKGKPKTASRVSYTLFIGEIPNGMCVCHHCDNPSCVNPEHLFLGDIAANNADMYNKGRNNQPGMKGESHHQAKLTNNQVLDIRSDSRVTKEIAIDYQVTPALIRMIKRKIIWKHI